MQRDITNRTDEDWDRMADEFIAKAEAKKEADLAEIDEETDDEEFDDEDDDEFGSEEFDDEDESSYDDDDAEDEECDSDFDEDENSDIYNKKQIYKTQIYPLLMSIKNICAREQIPFFTTFAIANEPHKFTHYVHDGVLSGSLHMDLANDLFEKLLLVLCGARVIPKGTNVEISDDDLKTISGILESEDFDGEDPEEDALSEIYDDTTENMAALAAKTIETKTDYSNGNYQ